MDIDYGTICRVLRWEYNYGTGEPLTEELFSRYYGTVMGLHYWKKWTLVYDRNLHDMLAYFGDGHPDGQLFCDMISEQMLKYEARQTLSSNGDGTKQ